MWILFDDARPDGAPPRLYAQPHAVVVADRLDEVGPALDRVRAAVAAGAHAAGWLAYEAGHAFDPKLADSFRKGDGPLLSFGLYDGYEMTDLAGLLPSPEGAFAGTPRRGSRKPPTKPRSPRCASICSREIFTRSI